MTSFSSDCITAHRHPDAKNVWLIGLNRPVKRNAFTRAMLDDLGLAYGELHRNPELRCGVLFAHGNHFTGGIDLAEFGPRFLEDEHAMAPLADQGGVDPLGMRGEPCRKPVVAAAQGICFTIGIELMLASDIRIAAPDTRLGQLEVRRGLYPLCGATFRLPAQCGWGNAMRWLLTGGEFDAAEGLRIGLIQEIHPDPVERAVAIAREIAEQAPLAVQATLASARLMRFEGERQAMEQVRNWLPEVATSEDFQEGIRSFQERRKAVFRDSMA
jgi:enoyl-CoA hydratase